MNGYNFTDRVRKVLQMAREEAARLRHEYVGTEHILLGIVREGEGVAAAVLMNLNVDFDKLRRSVEAVVKQGTDDRRNPDLPYTSRAKKVLELSMSEARELNHSYVGTEHLLLGVLREEKGIGAQALVQHGVELVLARAEVLRLLAHEHSDRMPISAKHEIDQRFTTAIALLELHRLRFGTYPESFSDLQFVGVYDVRMLQGLRYEKLSEGYSLDIVMRTGTTPDLSYPAEFWKGLGIRRTNVGRSS